MVLSLRSDRILADYCLIRGVGAGVLNPQEWKRLFDVYQSIKEIEPLLADDCDRIRAGERGAAS
jgi:hypothetical protein